MIVITGATGALNGATLEQLLERIPAGDVAVGVRDVAKAGRLHGLGVEVRRCDYADPDSLPAAFAGADQLLLVSSNDPSADAVALHRTAIDAAVAAGVGRILYTSHQAAAPDNPFAPGRDHYETEQLLAASGVPWTSLRNGFYSHSLLWLAGPWRESGVIAIPGDGPVSWTSREDLAVAAAVVVGSDGAYDGVTTLTAPAAPTFVELAEAASRLVDRTIRCEVMDEQAWLATQSAAGQPEPMAQLLLGFYRAAERGYFAQTSPLLGELLGRDPASAQDALV